MENSKLTKIATRVAASSSKLIVIMTMNGGKMIQGSTKTYSTWEGALKNFGVIAEVIEETEKCKVIQNKDRVATIYFLVDVFDEASKAALETKSATVHSVMSS